MYITWDLETTIVESFGRKANPLDEANYPVCGGFLYSNGHYEDRHMHREQEVMAPETFKDCTLMIGQNIRFDLMYYWRNPQVIEFFKSGGQIWDVQYAEYLLSAQEKTWASLDYLAPRYGGKLKPDKIKGYWEQGICTTMIDIDELLDYQEHDVRETERVFKGQYKRAKELGMLNTIHAHMDGLLALLEMEYNGLKIDKEAKESDQKLLEDELVDVQKILDAVITSNYPDLPFTFNWGSGKHVSALFFGGKIPYETREPNGFAQKKVPQEILDDQGEPVRFKGGARQGQIKTRLISVDDITRPKIKVNKCVFEFPRIVTPKEHWITKHPGVYSTDKDTIASLAHRGSKVAKTIKKFNELTKDLTTYYAPVDRFLYPDGFLHHSLNNVQTITGRLSSSKPNLQNLPRGDKSRCKRMFTSRFGPTGEMGEHDYSQLEVIGQAWLTGDEQMIADVNSGVDFHCKRLAYKLGEDYTAVCHSVKVLHDLDMIQQRTQIKEFSFQRAYGAGAAAISDTTGMTIPLVRLLEKQENDMYPDIKRFYQDLEEEVNSTRKWCGYRTELEEKVDRGYYVSPTGKRYVFKSKDLPKYKRAQLSHNPTAPRTQFYMPHMKNYPVQGLGGEIVIGAIGRLWRTKFLPTDNYDGQAFLVNTVHDCVWTDTKKCVTRQVTLDVQEVLEDIQGLFNERYEGLEVPVKFNIESEVGPNMYELEEVHYAKAA